MPSPRKQQKQKRRASAKAKEKRIIRNGGERRDPFAEVPSDNPFDAQGQISADALLDAMEDSGELDELFTVLGAAHETSLQAFCEAFLLSKPMQRLVLIWEEEELTDFIFGSLVSYKMWRDGCDDDTAVAWVESETFTSAYVAASEAIAGRA